jgi:hypothetical protein
MYPPGREALLQDPTVTEALQQVVAEGWTDEARLSAESALAAMSDRQQPDECGVHDAHRAHDGHKHVMLSYQWNIQETVKRIVNELQVRGYLTWFGAWSTRSLALDDDVTLSSLVCRPRPRLRVAAALTSLACVLADLDNMKGSTVRVLLSLACSSVVQRRLLDRSMLMLHMRRLTRCRTLSTTRK